MLFVSKCPGLISSVVRVNPSLSDMYNQFTALFLSEDIINLEKHFYSLNIDFHPPLWDYIHVCLNTASTNP